MRHVKRSLLALVLAGSVVGCGSGKVSPKELTPEQIAEQEAALKQTTAAETEHRKKSPRLDKAQTAEQEAQEAERNRRR